MSAPLDALTDRYLSFVASEHPVAATYLGLHTRDDSLGVFSAEALAFEREQMSEMLRDLESLDAETPGRGWRARVASEAARSGPEASSAAVDDRIDLEILRILLRGHLFSYDRLKSHETDPGYYIGAALSGCNQLLIREFAPLEERARCFAARLRDVPEVLAECKANVLRPPAAFASVGAEMARGGVVFLKEVVPSLVADVPALEADLIAASTSASEAFEDVASHCESLASESSVPFHVGRDAYEWILRERHLLDLDSDELLEIGRRFIAETSRAMDEVGREVDPSRTWREVVEDLQRRHPERAALRDFYAGEMARARDFVREKGLVTIPDGESLDVIDTPTFLRTLLPYAAYGPPGPFDRKQQGLFYVTPVNAAAPAEEQERQLRGHWTDNIRVIALHEGYPGHHVQLVRANMVPRTARKLAGSNVFIEGWALYCEEMMREAGFFSDPETRLCQLKATLWRAARIVVDVGLQRGEMSIAEAVDFMVSEAALVRVNAEAEVKRYAKYPTQPSSYLVGKREILKIRDSYERAKGASFDLLEFHDRLLDLGSIPPALAKYGLGLTS